MQTIFNMHMHTYIINMMHNIHVSVSVSIEEEQNTERKREKKKIPFGSIDPGELSGGGEEDKQEIDVAESGELLGFLLQAGLPLGVGHLLAIAGLDPLDGELHSPHTMAAAAALNLCLLHLSRSLSLSLSVSLCLSVSLSLSST